MKKETIGTVFLVLFAILILVGVFIIGKKIIDNLPGQQQDNNVKTLGQLRSDDSSPFSGQMFIDKNATDQSQYVSSSTEQSIADAIYNAFSFWHITDGYTLVLEQLQQLNTQVQIAQLSNYFSTLYSMDLATFLQNQNNYTGSSIMSSFGETSGLTNIINFVNNLPLS